MATVVATIVALLLLAGGNMACAQTAADKCVKASGDESIAACTEVIRQDKNAVSAYIDRGLAWFKKGEYDRAIADYNDAIRLGPEYASAYKNRGEAWIKKGEYDRAIADYNEVIRLNPMHAAAYNNRGLAWFEKGEYDKAIADYNEAIRLNPEHARAYSNRGSAWGGKGDHDKAIADTNEALRIDPKYAFAYTTRGLAWSIKGEYDRAISDLNEAIKLDPNSVPAYEGRGFAWHSKAEYAKAIADYNEAIRLDPSNTYAKNNLKKALDAKAAAEAKAKPSAPVVSAAPAAVSNKRVALVIGNAKYRHSAVLPNPPNDVQLLAATLRDAGFQTVVVKNDLTREGMMQALKDFAPVADNADWAAVYYSGHGIEFGGVNYMIPIDAQLKADRDIELEAVNIGQVMNTVEGARRLRLLVLDACRDNPFASQMRRTMASRSLGRGLARIEPEAGTLVVYAAKHGEVALDGEKSNSPFAEAMAKRIRQKPGIEIRRLFDFVRDDVLASTGRKQQPFSYGSISANDDFFFDR